MIQFLNILWGQICSDPMFYSRHAPSSLFRRRPLIHLLPPLVETITADRRVVFMRRGVSTILAREGYARIFLPFLVVVEDFW